MIDLTSFCGPRSDALVQKLEPFALGRAQFDFARRRFLVGVINLSPDSQYPESVATSPGQAIRKAESLVGAGANVLEFGAEATGYHGIRREADEQLRLLTPVLTECCKMGVPVAVEGGAADIFERVAGSGVAIFNLKSYSEIDKILSVARAYSATVVLPYLSGTDAHQHSSLDPTLAGQLMHDFFTGQLAGACKAGVSQVIIDPGLGFYFPVLGGERARLRYQLESYMHLCSLKVHNVPILVTLVQASSIFNGGYRRLAEPVLSVLALLGGANFIRTHEVAAVDRVRRLFDEAE